jgi:Cytochrome c
MSAWRAGAAGMLALTLIAPAGRAFDSTSVSVGESIYRHGMLGSGAPLEGSRQSGNPNLAGADAACANCHQRSGLGHTEGVATIPPITGQYLFHSRAGSANEAVLPYVESMHGSREPYDEATLARAIRSGIDSEGRPLGVLMPRFVLDDANMAALIGYLKTLDVPRIPGVTATLLHFATIITPDADPIKRRGMLDVLDSYFADKNRIPLKPSPPMRSSGKTMYSKSMYIANRHWQLHVWDLTGPAAGWKAQLDNHLKSEPVMAVVSGLGGSNWAPIHEFCERQQVPCLFPNVEVPVDAKGDFYSLYLSKGVLLEAELMAKSLTETSTGARPVKTVTQIYRVGDNGQAAAQALAAALQSHGIVVRNHALAATGKGRDTADALRGAAPADALVLWLRPGDVAALGEAPALPATVFMSGLMGGLEDAPLPLSWRPQVRLTYPFDLPEQRIVRVDYALGWFTIRRIPIVAQQVQADTYLACGLLSETLNNMADAMEPDYLVERMQGILEHRILTGYYPRLTLATGQSFASKGGYLVKFAQSTGKQLAVQGDWTVP